jgi:hypothetical protein
MGAGLRLGRVCSLPERAAESFGCSFAALGAWSPIARSLRAEPETSGRLGTKSAERPLGGLRVPVSNIRRISLCKAKSCRI